MGQNEKKNEEVAPCWICNDDFRRDEGGTSEWDYVDMMEAGQSYLDLPIPRKLTPNIDNEEIWWKRPEASKLLRWYKSPQYLAVMANSDIGKGTDPERSEQHILNAKRQILHPRIFATCEFCPGLSETVQTVHTITEESQLSNGKNIGFGIAGGFEGVQLGFEVATETSDWLKHRRIIAIADVRYQWATTASRIHREKLYKFLTDDCKCVLRGLNVDKVNSELSRKISRFIEEYGTHVVLKCTHGFRLEKVERMVVTSAKKLHEFKENIMASAKGYAGINEGRQHHHLRAVERTDNSLGIKNIGSKGLMKEAIESKGINFEKMNCSEPGNAGAGVISHDLNMMIGEMLLEEGSPYKTAAMRLRYWSHVRIDDLKAGWEGGLFATSYVLKFVQKGRHTKKCGFGTRTKKMNDKRICVKIGDRTVIHQHSGNDTQSYAHVTNVHSNEAKNVRISVLDDELKLKDVLAKITIYRRFLQDLNCVDDEQGLVVATEINMSDDDIPEDEWKLFDLENDHNWEPVYEEVEKGILFDSHVLKIGQARAKVCRLLLH